MIEHTFPTRSAAETALAHRIESALQGQLAMQEKVALAVSGGSTPGPLYTRLAEAELDWHRIQPVLTDERWVPPDHEASNDKLLRDTLLRARAACAQAQPYYDPQESLADRCESIDKIIQQLPLPFACVLLGMGEDGHFASLFPGAGGLDMTSPTLCIPVKAEPFDRLSLTLAALTRSDIIFLLIYGEAKRRVLQQAAGLPIASLLAQQKTPVHIYWAP